MDYEVSVDLVRREGKFISFFSSVFNASKPTPNIEQFVLSTGIEKKLTMPLEESSFHERELVIRTALQKAKMTYLYTEEMKRFAMGMDGKRRDR